MRRLPRLIAVPAALAVPNPFTVCRRSLAVPNKGPGVRPSRPLARLGRRLEVGASGAVEILVA